MRRPPNPETILLVGAASALVASYVLLFLMPSESYGKVGDIETITLNAWRSSFLLIALASSVVAMAVSIWTMRRRQRWGSGLLLALGIVSPMLCFWSFVVDLGAFQDAASVRDRDGTEYHLLRSAFLQGSQLDLVRLRRRQGPLAEYEVLVESPWEEGFGFLSVVRPQDALHDAEMVLTEDRMLVGIPYENMAFLAYDLQSGKPYSQIYSGNENSYTDLRELSPFLLLRPGDRPRDSDFQALLNPESSGRPSLQAVAKDLSNPNLEVRKLAKRLLADLRAHPPRR